MAAGLSTLEALTREFVDKDVFDNFFTSSALLYKLMKNKRTLDGGTTIDQPIFFGMNTDSGAWNGGFDELPMSQANIAGRASHSWTHYVTDIVYAETDKLKNSGKVAIADMVEAIARNALDSLKETIGRDIYLDGSNNARGARRLDGLSSIITTNGNPAPGPYGGISRSSSVGTKQSFTGNAWWNGTAFTVNGGAQTVWTGAYNISTSSTQPDLQKLNQMFVSLSVGDDAPDLIVMGPSLFSRFWQLIQTNERFKPGEDTGMTGFRYIIFNGVPITVDHNIDDPSKVYMLNTKYLFWRPASGSDMTRSPLRVPHRQRVAVSYIFWDGQMTCARPNMQGMMSGFTP